MRIKQMILNNQTQYLLLICLRYPINHRKIQFTNVNSKFNQASKQFNFKTYGQIKKGI